MSKQLVATKQVTVREADYDLDTGIPIQQGDTLLLDAWGTIWAGVWFTGVNGPNGWNWIDNDPKFPLPGTHPFCLLGKVGTGGYFYAGASSHINEVPNPGNLILRINDDVPGNGSGAFQCFIQVYRE